LKGLQVNISRKGYQDSTNGIEIFVACLRKEKTNGDFQVSVETLTVPPYSLNYICV
jgi:hypothetical protein